MQCASCKQPSSQGPRNSSVELHASWASWVPDDSASRAPTFPGALQLLAALGWLRGLVCRVRTFLSFSLSLSLFPSLWSLWSLSACMACLQCGKSVPLRVQAPIEGIAEALTVRPDLRDQSYRSLLDQRKEEETAASSRRSRHEERLIQGDERPAVVRATKPPAEGPGAALQDVLAVVEKALQSAGTLGLTGLELFERLPMGGCTLAQLRDSLLALAIPIQAEDGARRYAACRIV